MMSLAITLLAAAAWAGPVDRAATWSDAAGTGGAESTAKKAAELGAKLPAKSHRRVPPRAAAWVSVGRLGVLDAEIVDNARLALLTDTNAGPVRAQAAWALGEISRGRSWEEARPIALLLQEAMTAHLDADTAYTVVEAFGKAYTPHDHSFDENLAATRALNTLASNQTTLMPSIYYVVLNRVLTLEVAIKLLREEVGQARRSRSEQNLAEAYNAVLTTVRWLASHQEQLVNSYGDQKGSVASAFDALLGALDVRDRRMTLMLMWSLGNVSAEPAFAELVGKRASVIAKQDDPMVRMITAWSMYRLRASGAAREVMRDEFLGKEADGRVFEMLAAMRTEADAPDVVQRMYQVETAQ